MLKRFTSVILSLCIVASLFAGLSFSGFAVTDGNATEHTDKYGNKVYTRNTNNATYLASWDSDPTKSLIRDYDTTNQKFYYYISEQDDATSYIGAGAGIVYGTVDNKSISVNNFTSSTNQTSESALTADGVLKAGLFVTYENGKNAASTDKPTGLVNDESKQWVQINYELPAKADIESFFLGSLRSNAAAAPGHWKYYVADNEADLFKDEYCVAEIDLVNKSANNRYSKTELAETATGKWVGLRIICGYPATPTWARSSVYMRLTHFGVQGTYTTPAVVDNSITAKTSGANEEATASAVATLAGNTDKEGNSPYANVALSATDKYVGANGKIYDFDGWYLGDTQVADTATATYILTGAETTKEFTAKYAEKVYEEYDSNKYTLTGTHYAGQLTNNPIEDSLIVGKMPISAQVFNTIEGDFTVSNEPQDYTESLSSSMSTVTSATVNNGDARFFGDSALYKKMFIETTTNEGALASMTATDDETKQWVQFNYELDGVADIDNILFGRYAGGSKWDVGHFKLILSDTEEGLTKLAAAKAVIDVNSGTQANKANWNFAFTEDITAKYVGIRIIGMYNNNYGEWTETNYNVVYPRFTHLGVHGTYVDPIESIEGVTVEVEAQEGLPANLVSKGEGYYGNPDKTDKYGAYYIPVSANKTYSDVFNAASYTFDGWYVGEQKVSGKNEYLYNLASGSATLTAKYLKGDLDINAMVVETTLVNKYKEMLNTDKNLMQEGYTYGRTDHLSWEDAGTITYRANSSGSVSKPLDTVGTLALIDGNVSTHVDLLEPKFYNSENQLIEGTYVDLVINLLHVTELDALFVGLPSGTTYRPSKYSVYISETGIPFTLLPNEKEGANAATNRVFQFTNVGNDQCQVFEFPEGTKAKYIGIRIYNPVAIGKESSVAESVSYARFSEIGVFGKYDVEHFGYTYTSNMGDLINENGEAYNGKKLTFDAPLTKNGYSFKGFTVNGNDADATLDKDNNLATLKAEITADTQIIAVYENDPTALTSSKFAISADGNYVSIAKGIIAHTVTTGFDQYKNNIVVKDGETVLQDHEYVTPGMKVVLSAAGQETQEAEVVLRSDYDNDNDIDVTDILSAVDVIVNGAVATEYGSFAFDNGDGRFTVTDIVNARKAILLASPTTVYTENTYTMETLKYKAMGRTQESAGGRLYVKHAASGILFNADCYGDVKVTMDSSQFTHLTVVVDGVEHIIRTDYRGDYAYTVAEDLAPGVHTIEIYNQKAQDAGVIYASVTVTGEVLDAPKDKDLLIEFIGDSITCGIGNNSSTLDAYNDDATKAYGRLTAKALGADWSNISLGGSTVADIEGSSMVMPENYLLSFRGGNDWDFENERQADVVVINLGTNEKLISDIKEGEDEVAHAERLATIKTEFENALYDFTLQILELNSKKDVKVVFAFGMMTDEDVWVTASYQNVVARLTAEGITVPYCQLPVNTSGAALHPDANGHVAAAEVLSQFIKDNVLN